MCQKKSTKVTSGVVESDQDSLEKPGFEKEPETLKAGVVISNLKKSFGRKNAVDGVSMTMYEGEIFALLGSYFYYANFVEIFCTVLYLLTK